MDIVSKEFEELFNKNYKVALGYTIKKIDDSYIAEDIVMDTFYSCWKYWDKFDSSRGSFETWLYTILSNKIKNYFRNKKNTLPIIENHNFEEEVFEEINNSYEIAELRNKLNDALMKLNEIQRNIIIMKYFQNMTSIEMSEKLSISSGNVRIQLMRSLKKLKSILSEDAINADELFNYL